MSEDKATAAAQKAKPATVKRWDVKIVLGTTVKTWIMAGVSAEAVIADAKAVYKDAEVTVTPRVEG